MGAADALKKCENELLPSLAQALTGSFASRRAQGQRSCSGYRHLPVPITPTSPSCQVHMDRALQTVRDKSFTGIVLKNNQFGDYANQRKWPIRRPRIGRKKKNLYFQREREKKKSNLERHRLDRPHDANPHSLQTNYALKIFVRAYEYSLDSLGHFILFTTTKNKLARLY